MMDKKTVPGKADAGMATLDVNDATAVGKAAAPSARAVVDLSGTKLRHFQIVEMLGRGGMGVVYRALDEKLHRTVALKVLPTEISTHPDRRGRFLREARAAAAVTHPNIAAVYEVNEDEGQIFIVMELVEGQTLRRRLAAREMPLAEVLQVALQIARGMARAHDKGVLHRDLKPDNVMVGPDGEVKILDFGLAKRTLIDGPDTPAPQPAADEEAAHTRDGLIVGTPGYMSPEQAQGEAVDHRTDVYSFGVMLYEMATGALPFSGTTVQMLVAASLGNLMRPSARNARVTPELEAVILRCLARRPEERYPSARMICADLERLAGPGSSPAHSPLASEPTAMISREELARASKLPSGTVTLLAFGVEGAAQVLEALGERYYALLQRSHELIRGAFGRYGGQVVSLAEDGALAAFPAGSQALAAAVAAQRALATEPWPAGAALRIRMGLHTGEPRLTDSGYVGLDVHRAIRIGAAAKGGQILLSAAAREGMADGELANLVVRDLGSHQLKDLRYPEQIFEISVPGLSGPATSIRSVTNQPNNLPVPPTSFIGRERQIAEVCSLLRLDEVRLVTLTGPGGTGKTRLSIEVGRALLDEHLAGTLQVLLAPLRDPALIVTKIAQALGVPEAPGKPMIESVKSRIGDGRLLLLLDNFEQLVDGASVVAELLASCPNLKVLVTSQQPLRLSYEREYPVPPLQLPAADASRADGASDSEATRLFVERVRQSKPSFTVSPSDAPLLATICTRLDGLPLAIELAASRMKIMTLPALLDRLGDRLNLLKGGARDADQRHQTLRATIDWSYNLLDESEKTLFCRLGVFAGGFSIESAEEVCGFEADVPFDVLDGVSSLADKSLLTRGEVDGEPRLGMLETLREYALAQLRQRPEFETVRARHAEHFLTFAEAMAPELMGRDQRRCVGRMLTEADNVRAALTWALEQPSAETTCRFLDALLWLWIPQGNLSEGRGWAARASEQARRSALGGAASRELAVMLGVAGWLALIGGDYAAANTLSEESVAVYRALGAEADGARAKIALGVTSAALGRIPEGPDLVAEALAASRAAGDTYGTALSLIALGELARAMGDKEQARASYEEAMGLLRKLGNMFWPGMLIQNLAHFRLHDGDWQTAAQLLVETLKLGLEYNYPMVVNLYLAAMAGVAVVRGQPEQGVRLYGAVDTLLKSLGSAFEPTDQAEVDRHMATAKAALGEEAVAAAWREGAGWTRQKAIAATIPLRS
jgi:predicted ATPase/class 3 adenylate cyclase